MQLELEGLSTGLENPTYLTSQLITYLGNKRSLLSHIDSVVYDVRGRLGGRKLRTCDVFAGSGVVSRLFKQHSTYIHANDFEKYAALISEVYLTNKSDLDLQRITSRIEYLNNLVQSGGGPTGFIAEMYAPADDEDIKPGERVFYTAENARRLDAYAQLIQDEDPEIRNFLIAPLLSAASIHANTGGVFKGFYKDKDGNGRFGGSGADALTRIKAPIRLQPPILSNFETQNFVTNLDAAQISESMEEVDLVYLDPPYNQHPYGSNYFMLNLLVDYKRPDKVSTVSGIPEDWKRSAYNKRKESLNALSQLVEGLNSRFVLLSFSDDGFLEPRNLKALFESQGSVEVFDITYNTYRAARNLEGRSNRITEHLFLLDRGHNVKA